MRRRTPNITALAGMLACLQLGVAIAQVGFEPGAGVPLQTRGESPWFTHPDVRQELGMTSEQFDLLKEKYDRLWKRYNKEYKYFGTPVTEGELREREAEIYGRFDKDLSDHLNEVLTDRAARRRYDQVYRQYQGLGAFDDPVVQRELALSADQRKRLRQYYREWYDQLGRLRENYAKDPRATGDDLREARARMLAKIDSTLSASQRRKWREITGEPYEFPDAVFLP